MTKYSKFSISKKVFLICIFSVFLISCGATVAVDYDMEADFSVYKSYNIYPTLDSGLSKLDDDRIIHITDSLMQDRGLIKSETPQLYINFYANETVSPSRSRLGIGVGGGGGNVGVGVSGGIPIGGRTINQELIMDFIDVQNDNLVWQAVAEGELKERSTPEKKEAYYLDILQKILKKYPPKG